MSHPPIERSGFPWRGELGAGPAREKMVVHPNHILVYRVEADRIRMVNVVHTSRQYP